MASSRAPAQRGAALLLAMLVVTLVATLASAAVWQQWQHVAVEQAERDRLQAGWILTGSLDWARLILREDARTNQNTGSGDHLAEPWAVGLEEARLSSFLAIDKNQDPPPCTRCIPLGHHPGPTRPAERDQPGQAGQTVRTRCAHVRAPV
jgi:type II secretory pathway component PulK